MKRTRSGTKRRTSPPRDSTPHRRVSGALSAVQAPTPVPLLELHHQQFTVVGESRGNGLHVVWTELREPPC